MSHKSSTVGIAATVLCISAVLGSSTPVSAPFHVEVSGWKDGIHVKYCDFQIPTQFDYEVLEDYHLSHAEILAVQKSQDQVVQNQLLNDGSPNIFYCNKTQKKFLVLSYHGGTWRRNHFLNLPEELVGKKARFFVPHRTKKVEQTSEV